MGLSDALLNVGKYNASQQEVYDYLAGEAIAVYNSGNFGGNRGKLLNIFKFLDSARQLGSMNVKIVRSDPAAREVVVAFTRMGFERQIEFLVIPDPKNSNKAVLRLTGMPASSTGDWDVIQGFMIVLEKKFGKG